jgi:uncharacterized membrane protein YqaE (UPF0057 family)
MRTFLAFVCPPAAVLLHGNPSQGAVNCLLTLMLYLPGVLHALSVVGQYETDRRNETLMRLISRYEKG